MPTTGAEADGGAPGDAAAGAAAPSAHPTSVVTPRVIDVVAGIVFDASGKRVLLALRKPGQHQGNRWEFPGGKVEPGEALDAALARELGEEIGIVPTASRYRRTLEHVYPEKRVRLHFVDVTTFAGEPLGREGQRLRWVTLAELDGLAFPDANRAVVDELMASGGR